MIYTGDCLEILPTLEAESVQCVVTSPPYYGLRDYGVNGQIGLESTPEAYVEKLVAVFREVLRVLRCDGVLFLNLGDSYAGSGRGNNPNGKQGTNKGTGFDCDNPGFVPLGLKPKDLIGIPWRVAFALQTDGWYLRQDIIWHKPNPMPESVTDRCTKAHEYIFLLTKSSKYYYDAEAIKEDSQSIEYDYRPGGIIRDRLLDYDSKQKVLRVKGGRGGFGSLTGKNNDAIKSHSNDCGKAWIPAEKRNKRSVWTITTKPFNMWNETSRLVRVELDAVSGGMTSIVLSACPVHGYLCRQDSSRSGGEHGADALTHKERNGDPVQEPLFDCAPIAQTHGGDLLPENSGSLLPECFPSAIDHNTEKSKTVLVPETMPPCMPCGEIAPRTDDIQVPPLSFEQHPCMNGNNTWPDEMDVHLPDQTICRTVDSLSLPVPPECLCGYYHIVTKKSSHFATFPPEIPEICIKAGSKAGDTILDPFSGAGTTGLVAEKLGRKYVGIELNPAYVSMSEGRIESDCGSLFTERTQ